jgi:hypothetical protein
MSNSKTAIAEIKKLMKQFGFMSDESVLKSFKLEDNSILETSELKAGEKITRLNEEFERVALEDGKFRLVENFEIEVKDGKIESVKQIFVNAKLVDGTEIKVDGEELLAGGKVVVVTPDAEIPAPDGVHELEDGTKIETKDGVIVSVEEVAGDVEEGEVPEAPSVEVPPMVMSPDGEGEPLQVGEPKAPVAEGVVEPQEEIMSLLKDFIVKCSEKMSDMEKQMEAMKSDFSAFKKEPAAKPIANGKTDFNKQSFSNDLDSQIEKIMAMRKNNI